jgi:hypothetical protein
MSDCELRISTIGSLAKTTDPSGNGVDLARKSELCKTVQKNGSSEESDSSDLGSRSKAAEERRGILEVMKNVFETTRASEVVSLTWGDSRRNKRGRRQQSPIHAVIRSTPAAHCPVRNRSVPNEERRWNHPPSPSGHQARALLKYAAGNYRGTAVMLFCRLWTSTCAELRQR